MSQKLPNMLENTISKIREIVDANTVVGDPMMIGDITIVPVSKISIGLGGGGSDFETKNTGSHGCKHKTEAKNTHSRG